MSTWRQEEGGDETLENAGEENSEPRAFFSRLSLQFVSLYPE